MFGQLQGCAQARTRNWLSCHPLAPTGGRYGSSCCEDLDSRAVHKYIAVCKHNRAVGGQQIEFCIVGHAANFNNSLSHFATVLLDVKQALFTILISPGVDLEAISMTERVRGYFQVMAAHWPWRLIHPSWVEGRSWYVSSSDRSNVSSLGQEVLAKWPPWGRRHSHLAAHLNAVSTALSGPAGASLVGLLMHAPPP